MADTKLKIDQFDTDSFNKRVSSALAEINFTTIEVDESSISWQLSVGRSFKVTDSTDTSKFVIKPGSAAAVWTQRTSSFDSNKVIYCVAHNGSNLWVIAGQVGLLSTSPDGENWTSRTSSFGTSHIYGVAHDQSGLWVAVSSSGKLATSFNGIDWTQKTLLFESENALGIAHNGSNLWVAVGAIDMLATSSDGETWTSRVNAFTEYDDIKCVAHNQSDLWISAGDKGKLQTSSNGTAGWALQTSSFGITVINGIAHNGSNLWVAVGNDGKLATSPNGVDWTQRTSSFGSTAIQSIAYNGSDLWVAVSQSGKLATSFDGIDWTQRTSSFDSTHIMDVAHNGSNLWVAVGYEGKLATSPATANIIKIDTSGGIDIDLDDILDIRDSSGAYINISAAGKIDMHANTSLQFAGGNVEAKTDQADGQVQIKSLGSSTIIINAVAGGIDIDGKMNMAANNLIKLGASGGMDIDAGVDSDIAIQASADIKLTCSTGSGKILLNADNVDFSDLLISGVGQIKFSDSKWQTSHDGASWNDLNASYKMLTVGENLNARDPVGAYDGKLGKVGHGELADSVFNEGTSDNISIAHLNDHMFIIAYRDSAAANEGTARIGERVEIGSGINWTQRTNPFGVSNISDIAHNGTDLWVAVAQGGKLATSPDGIDWTQQTSSFDSTEIRGIAHNDSNLWVAVGDSGKLATSSNGIDWTQQTSSFSTTNIYAVAHNGSDLWVAVGLSGKLATSSNGIDWTQQTSSFDSTHIMNVAYNDANLWVAVGYTGKLATSPNGIDWTQQTNPFGTNQIYSIAHNGSDLWVAGSFGGLLATSPDGETWTQRTSSFGSTNVMGVAHNGSDLWVAVGLSGKLATSSNGIDWTQQTSSFSTTNIYGIAHNGSDLWVAVGSGGTIGTSPEISYLIDWLTDETVFHDATGLTDYISVSALSSDTCVIAYKDAGTNDGTAIVGQYSIAFGTDMTWTQQASGFDADYVRCVWHNNSDLWVIAGAAGKLATSENGIDWTFRDSTFGATYIRCIGYSIPDSLWLIGGPQGEAAKSSNGIDWIQVNTYMGNIHSMVHNGLSGEDGLWVAVGATGKIRTSPDGDSWTNRTNPFGAEQIWDVAYSTPDSLWVAVANNKKICTSPDGIAWTNRANPFGLGDGIEGVQHNQKSGGDGLWVAVADYGKIATSPNGTDWTLRDNPSGEGFFRGVDYDQSGLWVAVASPDGSLISLLTSPDGINWTYSDAGFGSSEVFGIWHNKLSGVDGLWVAVGKDGKLATCPGFDPALGWLTSEEIFNEATGPGTKFISTTRLSDDTFAIAYQDGGNSDYGTAIVGTYTGTGISWSSESAFHTAIDYSNVIATLNGNIFVVAYHDSGNTYGTVRVGQYSGGSISWLSSATVFNSAATYDISVATLNDDTFLLAYKDGGNSNYGTVRVGQYIGGVINWLTDAMVFNAAATTYISAINLENNMFAIAFADAATTGAIRVGQYDNIIKWLTDAQTFNTAEAQAIRASTLTENMFMVTYKDVGNSNWGTAKAFKFAKYVGFNKNLTSVNQQSIIMFKGLLDGFTNLIPGSTYFLDYDNKSISENGTIELGVATSTTELLLR